MSDRPYVTNPGVTNPRKIHSALFIEKVEDFAEKYPVEKILEALQEAYGKYKMMETTLTRSKENMKVKIPEIKKALDVIDFLEKKRDENLNVEFMVTDAVWAQAKVPQGNTGVRLWLGANIMVEYTFEEARTLLTKNLENATQNLSVFEEDLSFLKDQVTTVEVNIARVYNYNVKLMQEKKLAEVQGGAPATEK